MRTRELTFLATNDLAGQTRGRALWRDELDPATGCGWVPANLGVGPFGKIVETRHINSTGDLRLVPDPASEARLEGIPGKAPMSIFMADIKKTDGSGWECCPRTFLRRAVEEFRAATGLELVVAFEHEFMFTEAPDAESPFSFQALRRLEPFGTDLMKVLQGAGLEPETWLPEYGSNQWEVTVRPSDPLVAADRAILLREVVREVAHAAGKTASFTPALTPTGTGSGVHVHFSFRDPAGAPAMFDAAGPGRMSKLAGSFAAGVLRHARALMAICSPSEVSYIRLAPHNWSSSSSFLGERNREALLRICPTLSMAGHDEARQFNLEFRAADATANPWLLLGSVIRAGLDGIGQKLDTPHIVDVDLDELSEEQRTAAGISPLPASLREALDALSANETVSGFFDPQLLALHHAIKTSEIEQLAGMSPAEKCARYASAY